MVKSNLNSNVNYPEYKMLNEEDKNMESSLYEMELLNVSLLIALGNIKYSYENDNIVYYPIYVIKDNNVGSQIGVYEILQDKLSLYLDAEGDLDITSLEGPLLYSFANYNYLKKYEELFETDQEDKVKDEEAQKNKDDEEEEDEEEEEEDEEEEDEEDKDEQEKDDEIDKDVDNKTLIENQTADQSNKEKQDYVDNKNNNWIQKYFKSNNYEIIKNEGSGDCLFASIRDALKEVNIDIPVPKMRKMLSEEATDDLFQSYSELYNYTLLEYDNITKDVKKMAAEFKVIKKKIEEENEKSRLTKMMSDIKKVTETHKQLKLQQKELKSMLEEFEFMKGINTLEALKAKIQTSDYWADTWAISTLERILKIKLILLSKEKYEQGEVDNILTCGQLNDSILEKAGIFEPKFYIILNYLGYHYELVTYKDRETLLFKEIPYDIKKLIINKCIEKAAGPYYIIPDFKKYMQKLNITLENDVDSNTELYDDSTVFQFYYKSSDVPKPGKGTGEKLGPEGVQEYVHLASIPKWRKKLSNLWEQEFILDNKKWLTVEHYYQASKYKKNNLEHYNKFALNSNSDVSRDPKKARELGSNKKISVDNDFFNGRNQTVIEDALRAKFTQNKDLGKLLVLTKRAKLQLYIRGSQPLVSNSLMKIRKELNKIEK